MHGATLIVAVLCSHASALKVTGSQPSLPATATLQRLQSLRGGAKSDEVDRYSHIRVPQVPTYVASFVATAVSVAALVVTPEMLEASSVDCTGGIGLWAVGFTAAIQKMKTTNPLELTMALGLLLKAVAEVLAQVIVQGGDPLGAWLDPLRVCRSTFASLLSSSLSFYYWTRLPFVRALTAPAPVAAVLGKTFGTSLTKMVVTQALYRPINVGLFLSMQSLFRGDSARELVEVMRTKFKGGLMGGIAFFSVSNMIMFSVPIPFLHPIIGAIAGLIFNVWLAIVAYKK